MPWQYQANTQTQIDVINKLKCNKKSCLTNINLTYVSVPRIRENGLSDMKSEESVKKITVANK